MTTIHSLFVDLINDALSEITYDATLAGLNYELKNTAEGLYVSISGYNDKLPILLASVIQTLKDVEIREDRLKVFAEQVRDKNLPDAVLGVTYPLNSWSFHTRTFTLASRRTFLNTSLTACSTRMSGHRQRS